MLKLIIATGLGSFAGGISRFLLSRWIQLQVSSSFPWGTFVVNIAGCFIIGILFSITENSPRLTNEWRLILNVGFCGSFTTFSTFAFENLSLIKSGQWLHFSSYTILSLVLGFLAVYAGIALGKLFFGKVNIA